MDAYSMTLGEVVRMMARRSGLTQSDLAKKLGRSRSWANEMMARADEGDVSLTTLREVTQACGFKLGLEVGGDAVVVLHVHEAQ